MTDERPPWERAPSGSSVDAFGETVEIWRGVHRFAVGWYAFESLGRVLGVGWGASDQWVIRCFGGREWNTRFPGGFDATREHPVPDLTALGIPDPPEFSRIVELADKKIHTGQAVLQALYSFPDGTFQAVDLTASGIGFYFGSTEPAPDELPVAVRVALRA